MDIDQKRDVILCVLALFVAGAIGLGSLSYQIASSYFPMMLVLFMAAMAVVLLLRTMRRTTKTDVETDLGEIKDQSLGFAKVFGAIIAYIIGITVFGYAVATVLFLALAMLLFGERRWLPIVAVALGMTAMLVALFFAFLGVSPPESLFTLL